MTTTLSRETAILQLEDLTARVCQALADEDVEAVDLLMTAPSRPGDEADATQLTVCGGLSRLTQLWVVIGVLHGIATKGKKLTQASHKVGHCARCASSGSRRKRSPRVRSTPFLCKVVVSETRKHIPTVCVKTTVTHE